VSTFWNYGLYPIRISKWSCWSIRSNIKNLSKYTTWVWGIHIYFYRRRTCWRFTLIRASTVYKLYGIIIIYRGIMCLQNSPWVPIIQNIELYFDSWIHICVSSHHALIIREFTDRKRSKLYPISNSYTSYNNLHRKCRNAL